jgi:hypothetical protein
MVRVMYSKEAKGFTDLSLLVCVQSVLFGKLGGAFGRRTSLRRSCTTLRWLHAISRSSLYRSSVSIGLPWRAFLTLALTCDREIVFALNDARAPETHIETTLLVLSALHCTFFKFRRATNLLCTRLHQAFLKLASLVFFYSPPHRT